MSVVDEIKARLDIVDVVSETVSLKKSGQSFTGFCPFHQNTRTPSFVVFPNTQTWRCFGACADGGDIFSFVMKRDGYEFRDALEVLAKQAGVTLESSASQQQQQAERNRLIGLTIAAAQYYHQQLLNNSSGQDTRRYLTQRDITSDTIATFQLGYAPNKRDALKQHLLHKGYSLADLLATGLVTQPDDGSTPYDRFRGRLMIPIRNRHGQVVGFGARALRDGQQPKYLNSPQTELFDKSRLLYGFDLAYPHIRQSKQVVVVEGYMDVIQAHQRGAKNVVAQMGTSLTEPQLKRLTTGSPKIILALDSDNAGNAATIRSLNLARQRLPKVARPTANAQGVAFEPHTTQEVFVVSLPQGKDPDDVLREGLAVWQTLLDQAVPSLNFYEQLILSQADIQTPQGKSYVVHELIPVYREMADEIEKTARTQQLARKIGLDERLILQELHATTTQEATPSKPVELESKTAAKVSTIQRPSIDLEDYCLALILHVPMSLAIVNDVLEKHHEPDVNYRDFNGTDNREIFRFVQLWTTLGKPDHDTLAEMVEPSLKTKLNILVTQSKDQIRIPTINKVAEDLRDQIIRLRHEKIRQEIEERVHLQHQQVDRETVKQHQTQINFLKERVQKLSSLLRLNIVRQSESEPSQVTPVRRAPSEKIRHPDGSYELVMRNPS